MVPARTHGSRKVILLLSILIISAGAGIYLLFRPGDFVFHRWFMYIGLDGILNSGHPRTAGLADHLPSWFLYSLPDGLWAYAYALLIAGIWAGSSSMLRYLWYFSIPILILGFEILQGLEMIPGTFSLLDLVFGIAGLGAGIGTVFLMNKYMYYETDIK